jgi:transcriptional regulator with XRE-family HTH domain
MAALSRWQRRGNIIYMQLGRVVMREKELPPIAEKLKALREAHGLTQQELAFQSGLSISIIAQIEQGGKVDPRISTVNALAKALGVGIQDLTGDVSNSRPRKKK